MAATLMTSTAQTLMTSDRLKGNLDAGLTGRKQFLLWKYKPNPVPGKKPSKVPYYTSGIIRHGMQGAPEDLAQMATFSEALSVFEHGDYDGIGIAMLDGAGLIGIDFDECVTDRNIPAHLEDLIKDTYTEFSPSGSGIRAFYFGQYENRKDHSQRIEVFCKSGFLTLTGDRFNDKTIIPLPEAIKTNLDSIFGPQKTKTSQAEQLAEVKRNDPVYQRLDERGMVRKNFGGGRIGIVCPFADEHTTGDGDADAVYFLPHTNGYEQGNFHCLHAHCAERRQADFLRAIGLDPRAARAEKWGDPQPLIIKVDGLPYPADALPGLIKDAVEEVQQFVKAPLPLVAAVALSAVSSACQAFVDVERARNLSGPVSLNVLSIADSGERKTTCDSFFTKAIREYEAEQFERAKPQLKAHEAGRAIWEAKRSALLDSVKKAVRSGHSSTDLERQLTELQQSEPAAPRCPRVLMLDQTPEALAWHLARVWPTGAVLSSEAGVVFGAHGMNRESVMRNLALLNLLWDGGTFDAGRRSTGSVHVEGARLSLGLQAQESTLLAFLDRSEGLARGTGWLARFLISWPESTMGCRMFTEAPESWPALSAFNRRMAEILNAPLPVDENYYLQPQCLTLSPAAKAAWVSFHDHIEAELRGGGELQDIRDVAAKSGDNAARLAALFHYFHNGAGGVIELEDFARAAQIVSWHLTEAVRFFGQIALPAEVANAARLDAWLIDYCQQNKTCEVPTRTAQRMGPNGIRDGEKIGAAVAELHELNRGRLVKDGKRKLIQINPALVEVAR